MDKKSPFMKWMVLIFVTAIGVTGFGVASFISKINIYAARGALGCAFIYLLSREVDFRFKREPFQVLYNFPHNVRYFVWAFGLSLFLYWGIYEIIPLAIFVIRSFISK
jgi:hypothetical protein